MLSSRGLRPSAPSEAFDLQLQCQELVEKINSKLRFDAQGAKSIFGNYVDREFVGFPSNPQKSAEWMGHGSLK
jgi:hypothetical protein